MTERPPYADRWADVCEQCNIPRISHDADHPFQGESLRLPEAKYRTYDESECYNFGIILDLAAPNPWQELCGSCGRARIEHGDLISTKHDFIGTQHQLSVPGAAVYCAEELRRMNLTYPPATGERYPPASWGDLCEVCHNSRLAHCGSGEHPFVGPTLVISEPYFAQLSDRVRTRTRLESAAPATGPRPPLPQRRPHDPVSHPSHYTSHPSGVECVTVTEHMTFNSGNVVKYLWRAGLKDAAPSVQDLLKALFYLKREVRRQGGDPDGVD